MKRLSTFEQAGVSLELVATIEFPSEAFAFGAERFLKLIFKEKHLKGEWFLLEDSDIALFLQLAKGFESWRQ